VEERGFYGRIPFAWLGYAYYNDGVGFGAFDVNNVAGKNKGDVLKDGAKTFAFNNGQARSVKWMRWPITSKCLRYGGVVLR
jgi:hypothetical protein